MPNLNATNNNNKNLNNQNPVLALSIPNINITDPLPSPAKKGFFGSSTKEKPKKILKVKKVKEPKAVKVKEPKPIKVKEPKPIKDKENKIKNLQMAAAPETIPKSLEPFLTVKIPEKKIEEVAATTTYNDPITIRTTSEVQAAAVKPIPRTTGINYATQNENGYNDSITNKSFVRLESYDEIQSQHGTSIPLAVGILKLDDDDDFGNWNAVANHRKGINHTTAVVQAAQVNAISRTNVATAASNDNANLLMERPKTLREQQNAQRTNNNNNNNSSGSSSQENGGFKLRRSDSEESDTEA